MLNIILPILFFLSFFAILFFFYRKIPVLSNIPMESIQNKETFFSFLRRSLRNSISHFKPKRIKIYFLSFADNILARFRSTTLKMHKTIDILSKDVKQRSQQEKWKHHWFSHKEKNKVQEGAKKTKEG